MSSATDVRTGMNTSRALSLALAAAVALPGCYFYKPSLSSSKKIDVTPGGRVELKMEGMSYEGECRRYDKPGDCHISNEGITATRSFDTYQAFYGGNAITQHQLRQLVDPDFDKKLKRIKDDNGTCNISLVPTAISFIGMLGLMYGGLAYDKLGDAAVPVALGAAGAALGGALLSYPLGGYACVRAARRYKAMFGGMDPNDSDAVVYDQEKHGAYIDEMKKLADDFNAKFGTGAAPDVPAADAPDLPTAE